MLLDIVFNPEGLTRAFIFHVFSFQISNVLMNQLFIYELLRLIFPLNLNAEYGAQGMVSTSGDVYSFGIMLLELCTNKRPTNDMFGEEMGLKSWVSLSLHENAIIKVVDATLLEGEEKDFLVKEQCLSSLLSLAMECLATSPLDRIKISEVVVKLNKIRNTFVAKTKE